MNMTKDLKFRVWDKKLKIMIYQNNDNLKDFMNKWGDNDLIMQSTHFIDLNGLEIFEGDLVKVIGSDEIYKVEWSYHHGGVRLMLPVDYQKYEPSNKNFVSDNVYIVGNIFN